MRSLSMHPFAVAAVAVGMQLCVTGANAQSQQAPNAPSATTPAPQIPDQKLDAMAAAIQRVAMLQQDYQQRLASAPDGDKQRLRAEGQKALVKAVTDQGLTVDEYTSIIDVAKSDPAVREKLMKRLPSQGQ